MHVKWHETYFEQDSSGQIGRSRVLDVLILIS